MAYEPKHEVTLTRGYPMFGLFCFSKFMAEKSEILAQLTLQQKETIATAIAALFINGFDQWYQSQQQVGPDAGLLGDFPNSGSTY